jgi:iron complex transport system substrate-binding protein
VVGGLDTGGMSPHEIDDYVRGRLAVGGDLYTLHERAMAELQPGLILTRDLYRGLRAAVWAGRRRAGLPWLPGPGANTGPHSLIEVLDSILTVGQAAGVPGRARRLVSGLRNRLAAVVARVEH